MEIIQQVGDSLILLMCLYAIKQINENNKDCREFITKMTDTYLRHIESLVKAVDGES